LLTTNKTNNSEKGLIAEKTIDIGFLRSHRIPVKYAIKSTCLRIKNPFDPLTLIVIIM